MDNKYGIGRVPPNSNVLPTSAWMLDNSKEILENELRVSIKKIHIETSSFKQICVECNYKEDEIKSRILEIIGKRGKLHNPITDTGGVIFGVIEEIGGGYINKENVKVGDEVICNVSLATIPLYIDRITSIDFAYSQIEADGYGIVLSGYPIVKKPKNVNVDLMLFGFDESGTLLDVANLAKGKKTFLLVGSNMLTNYLYGYAIKKVAGEDVKITCIMDSKTDAELKGENINEVLSSVFDKIHTLNILRPIECVENINIENSFDMSVNCADIPGAETINVLATKNNGVIYFTNLINNHYMAVYITESMAKNLEVKCAQGYIENYEKFNIDLVREISTKLQDVTFHHKLSEEISKNLWRQGLQETKQAFDIANIAEDFICSSKAMRNVLESILSVAKYDCNVLITGETGVGKEKVAALIHKNSNRNMQPFVKINCAAISENLIESEMFGYEKGSFTGASVSGKKGYFEIADNGIIFLDEVGELSLEMQAKLLRVIQEGEFYKVGGVKPIKTNVRIISATNRDLEAQIQKQVFRMDLFYRLNVYPIRVPGLDERRDEIPALVEHFTKKYNEKFHIEKSIMKDAVEYLKDCRWTGNIRELENTVQRLLISVKSDIVTIFDVMRELNADIFPNYSGGVDFNHSKIIYLEKIMQNFESEIIRFAVEKYGSTRKAASALGISQTQLVRKKNKYEI